MNEEFDWTEYADEIKELSFPILNHLPGTYYDRLEEKLKLYYQFVTKLVEKNPSIDNTLIETVDRFNNKILSCIKSYYEGKSETSFNSLFGTLENLSDDIIFNSVDENQYFFRMRTSEETLRNNISMFHIPFSKRYLVESQRYSIAGLPCLYLGSSHFICWYELNKPNFNNLYSSSFQSRRKLTFLDISKDLCFITDNVKSTDLLKSLRLYPLTLACNFHTAHLSAKFNEEYIIPNLLLQWVLKSKDVDGIQYMSVKYCENNYRDKLLNFVLPPKEFSGKNYCSELSKYFIVTDPSSFAVLMYGPNPSDVIAFQTISGSDPESALLETYDTTIFGRTETIIKQLPHKAISIN